MYLHYMLKTGNQYTNLRLMEASGSHPCEEHQDHPLDLGQDLLICHLDVEDEVKCLWVGFYLLYRFPPFV